MNFRGLESASIRVLKYAKELDESNSTMYAKTRVCLGRCCEYIEQALSILSRYNDIHIDVDHSVSDSGPIHELSDNKYDDVLDHIQAMSKIIEKVCKDVENLKSVGTVSDDTIAITESVESNDLDDSRLVNSEYSSNITSSDSNHSRSSDTSKPKYNFFNSKKKSSSKRKSMSIYRNIFDKLPEDVYIYTEPYECADLLRFWFSHRFDPKNYPKKGFSMKYIKRWAQDIILAYGYSIKTGTKDQFIDKFKYWCETVNSDDPYALPYFVYKFDKDLELGQLNKVSVGIECIFQRISKLWGNLKCSDILGKYAGEFPTISSRYSEFLDTVDTSKYDTMDCYPVALNLDTIVSSCNFHVREMKLDAV